MRIPTEWAALLARIHTLAPQAVIAGGALRDLDNGRQVKDLDVFVPQSTDMAELAARVSVTHGDIVHTCPGDYIDGAHEVAFTTSFATKRPDLIPDLNVIQLRSGCDVQSIAERVDFGLCQISWNGGFLWHTPAYAEDKKMHTFTVTRADSAEGFARTMRRYERLRQKYVGWKLVIPERLARQIADRIAEDTVEALP